MVSTLVIWLSSFRTAFSFLLQPCGFSNVDLGIPLAPPGRALGKVSLRHASSIADTAFCLRDSPLLYKGNFTYNNGDLSAVLKTCWTLVLLPDIICDNDKLHLILSRALIRFEPGKTAEVESPIIAIKYPEAELELMTSSERINQSVPRKYRFSHLCRALYILFLGAQKSTSLLVR